MAAIAFLVHPSRPDAAAVAHAAVDWLEQRGHRTLTLRLDPSDLVLETVDGRPLASVDLTGYDLAVSVGGDGTFLRLVAPAAAAGIPVLGVNFGRLGYLLEVPPSDVTHALERFLVGDIRIEDRVMLTATAEGPLEPLPPAGQERDVLDEGRDPARPTTSPTGEVTTASGPATSWLALNEVVLEKTVPGHTVHVRTEVDSQPLQELRTDGVLVATPTGSTAYNLSAGGPALAPLMRAMVVTAVAPHLAVDCSVVLEDHRQVGIHLLEGRPAALVVDGQPVGRLRPGATVRCEVAPRPFRLVTLGRRPLASAMRTVLARPVDD